MFKVISSSKYEYNEENEKYANDGNWNKGQSGQVHLPGTEYLILLPLRGREQRLVTSVEVDAEYQYDMDTEYEVKEYEEEPGEEIISKDAYASQEQKEAVINELAKKVYGRLNELEESIDSGKVFIAFFRLKNGQRVSLKFTVRRLFYVAYGGRHTKRISFIV